MTTGSVRASEVARRTPAFSAWQYPHWPVRCRDAAAFLGEAGYPELAQRPEALAQPRSTLRLDGWQDENRLEHVLTHLGQGSATAMLLRCTVCGTELAYVDADGRRLLPSPPARQDAPMPSLLTGLPALLWTVPYAGSRYPGSPAATARPDLALGANCQLYAYEVLRHFGRRLPPLRSAELWADRAATREVSEPAPLDLLLYSPDGTAYGAHVGVWVAEDSVLHLCREVGHPALWHPVDFAARPRYRRLVGVKRAVQAA